MPISFRGSARDTTRVCWNTSTDWNKGTIPSELEVSGSGDAAIIRLANKAGGSNNIDFNTGGDYTLSNGSLIEVAAGLARLLVQAGETADFPFTTGANYTFDSAKIEVTGGVAKLLDQRPTDASFFANYNTDEDGNWGDGTLTGTLNSTASVTGGNLDVTGGTTGKSADYDADANADSQQTGCIRFGLIPDYSGSPASFQTFFVVGKASGTGVNAIYVFHQTDGNVIVYIVDSTGTNIISSPAGAWSPTSGTEYEFELNFDITAGATRLFIDGTQLGSTFTDTGTRDAQIALLRIGNTWTNGSATRFKINYFIYFTTVQHTANYTPDGQSGLPDTIFATDDPTVVNNTGLVFTVALDTFTETSTKPAGSAIQYHSSSDDGVTWEYWTGAVWAVTDDTFAQSNTASDIETNIGTLAASGTFKFRALLNSDGAANPELDRVQVAGPTTFSTIDDLYVETKDASQINPTNFVDWLTVAFTSTTPTNTDLRILFSVDDRVSWLTWSGSAWVAPASATTRTDATSLTDATTNFGSLPSTKPLDVRVFVRSTDASVTPSMDLITITSDTGFDASGVYVTNQYNSTEINNPWDQVAFTTTIGSGGSIVIKARSANSIAELDAEAYGSALSNGDDAGVTGQYIQFQITFTGDGVETSSINRLCVDYEDPARAVVSP